MPFRFKNEKFQFGLSDLFINDLLIRPRRSSDIDKYTAQSQQPCLKIDQPGTSYAKGHTRSLTTTADESSSSET